MWLLWLLIGSFANLWSNPLNHPLNHLHPPCHHHRHLDFPILLHIKKIYIAIQFSILSYHSDSSSNSSYIAQVPLYNFFGQTKLIILHIAFLDFILLISLYSRSFLFPLHFQEFNWPHLHYHPLHSVHSQLLYQKWAIQCYQHFSKSHRYQQFHHIFSSF